MEPRGKGVDTQAKRAVWGAWPAPGVHDGWTPVCMPARLLVAKGVGTGVDLEGSSRGPACVLSWVGLAWERGRRSPRGRRDASAKAPDGGTHSTCSTRGCTSRQCFGDSRNRRLGDEWAEGVNRYRDGDMWYRAVDGGDTAGSAPSDAASARGWAGVGMAAHQPWGVSVTPGVASLRNSISSVPTAPKVLAMGATTSCGVHGMVHVPASAAGIPPTPPPPPLGGD